MCDECAAVRGEPVEITEETAPYMVQEVTVLALHAASALANGWLSAAKGFHVDMLTKWGAPAAVRAAYVWGSARCFLPGPPGGITLATHEEIQARFQEMGQQVDSDHVTRVLAQRDQNEATVQAIATAAGMHDMEAIVDTLASAGDRAKVIMVQMLTEAGARMRYARDNDQAIAIDLFESHVYADLPEEGDEDQGEGGREGGDGDQHP